MRYLQSLAELVDALERGDVDRGDTAYVDAHRYARLDFSERARLWRLLRSRGVHLVTEAWVGEQVILRRRGERYLQDG